MNKAIFSALLAGTILAGCSKSNNNSPGNNNNNNNNSPKAPSLTITPSDTTMKLGSIITYNIHASVNDATATLDSFSVSDGLGFRTSDPVSLKGKTSGQTFAYYEMPATVAAGVASLTVTFTLYDSKGNTTTKTATVNLPTHQTVFKAYTVTVLDQNSNGAGAFLNTGTTVLANFVLNQGQTTGSDTGNRRLVDIICVTTAGQTDILVAPTYTMLTDTNGGSGLMAMNTWLPKQKNNTQFIKLSLASNQDVTSFKTESDVQTAYNAAVKAGVHHVSNRVEKTFSPSDNYAFLTADGRYGAFTVLQIGGGVKMTMMLQSR